MDDFVKPILVIFLIMCVFTGIALFCGYHISKDACYSKYADFEPEYHGLVTGCLVQYNGKTVPVESLRVME